MGKALIIAEKPSVAGDIAKVLGKFKKEKDWFENDDYVVSSAVGHLIEIGAPASVEPKRGKWNIANLPVIPPEFELKPIEKSEARFKVLKKLIARKDIDRLINACDAGREGELIFRYIVQAVGSKKPIQRLWLQSMTPDAIRSGFKQLRSDEDMIPLAEAARCRSEADWLVGINGTRALTSFNSKAGGFNLTPVGRVQTPTLAILVKREEQIRGFHQRPYWELHATFAAASGEYPGRWFDEAFKKPEVKDEADPRKDEKAERLWTRAQAEAIAEACAGREGIVEQKSKPATQLSPLLFDLTSLQREANSKFGFPARMTLSIAQSLYERHKALTYPRTDSRYLPEDYLSTVTATVGVLAGNSPLAPFAQKILQEKWVKPSKRIFNSAKVSDHFAIIPTQETPKNLKDTEQRIYDLVCKRFLAVFYPAAVFEVTTRITRVEGHAFKTEGKVLKDPGWLAIYGKEEQKEESGGEGDSPTLPPVKEGERVETRELEVREELTRPPARFSEATLLSAMEGAGKLVDDEELRDAMSARGLGTPATRASIIESLIDTKYVERRGRELLPTVKAFDLLETLHTMRIEALSSPELTGDWEYKLKLIEDQKLTRPDFMREIEGMTRDMVGRLRLKGDPGSVKLHDTDLLDPFQGRKMIKTLGDYRTEDGAFAVPKVIAGRIMDLEEVRELMRARVVGPLDGFRSRLGRTFSAYVKMDEKGEVSLDWGATDSQEPPNFEGQEPIGICPATGRRVFETPNAYVTEPGEDGKKGFRMSRKILEQDIPREQVVKLLTEKKTDLFTAFVSKKTRRPFKAFLILKDDGTTSFEFPPREPKAPKGKGKGKAAQKKSADPADTQPD
jgi:DNA topoisomerase-3